jgi:hypothetical protein
MGSGYHRTFRGADAPQAHCAQSLILKPLNLHIQPTRRRSLSAGFFRAAVAKLPLSEEKSET